MPKIAYVERKFSADSQTVINQANEILAEYDAQGYVLTLRQLYYQFVSRDLIPNNQKSYKRLGSIINDARLAGQIDWNLMEDRTRNLVTPSSWTSPEDIIRSCADCFRLDPWAKQPYRPEVWIEKDALAGVFERVCDELRVPYFSCRGYCSQSEMWTAAQRFIRHRSRKQKVLILHFGDHDPSGIDMTRDIGDRLRLFTSIGVEIKRLALNMDQVEQYEPPPNPAKTTDSRYEDYMAEHGEESWELDALEPDVLAGLVRDAIDEIRDQAAWDEVIEDENEHRRLLGEVAENWHNLTENL